MLLSAALTGVLLTAGVVLFIDLQVQFERVQHESVLSAEAERLMHIMTERITRADAVTTPASYASSSQLVLAMSTHAVNPTVFDVASSTLRITEGSGSVVPLSVSGVAVTSLVVTNTATASTPASVQLVLKLENTASRTHSRLYRTYAATTSATIRAWP